MRRISLTSVLLAILTAFSASTAIAEPTARDVLIREVAQSSYWLRLLHYKASWLRLGMKRSLLDGPEFFFSPQGKTDPEAELRATLDAFTHPELKIGNLKQSPVCAFPERFRFLAERFQLPPHGLVCKELDDYFKRFKGQGASLVFSTAYANNPGSMFGHTFLKINTGGASEILDEGINFAAQVGPDENGFAFAWFGLTGGYLGQFSMLPYYVKVNEYINAESRDLWEYELDLSTEQTRRMLAHIWEIETTSYFDYYFFDENCSFMLLTVLEIARPDWDLSDFGVHVIPAETIKRVAAIPGAIRSIRFRPSLRRKWVAQVAALAPPARKEYEAVVSGELKPEDATSSEALDTAIMALQYEKQKNEGKLPPERTQLRGSILLKRSKMSTPAGDLKPVSASVLVDPKTELNRPDQGHHPHRLGLTPGLRGPNGGNPNWSYFQEIAFKFAYHDLMNLDRGYIPFSQIDFPHFTLRYNWGPGSFAGLTLENLTLLSITSLFPLGQIENRVSWRVHTEIYRPRDYGCDTCTAIRTQPAVGGTLALGTPRALLVGLGSLQLELFGIRQIIRGGPGAQMMLLVNLWEPQKWKLSASVQTDLFQTDRQVVLGLIEAEQAFSVAQWFDFRVAWLGRVNPTLYDQETKLSLNFFF